MPVGHGIRGLATHAPAASQVRVVMRPPAQLAVAHSMPTARGDQSVVLRVGSQTWHGYVAFTVPSPTHAPPIVQPVTGV
jgi:hypothetical protein